MSGGFLRGAYARLFERDHSQNAREFLPAALEVIETPPSPTGRILGLLIVLFFGSAVAWAFLARVDVQATAHGRVAPIGEVKTIQSLDPGIVRAIHVQDGDHVTAGQLLIELDPTQSGADRDRLTSDLMHAKLDVARLTALKNAFESNRMPVMLAPAETPPDLVEEAKAAMLAQADQQASKLADLSQQIDQKAAERSEVDAQIDELNATMPMLAEKERMHQQLRAQGYGTSFAYLDAQQQLTAARHEIEVAAQRRLQDEDARSALVAQRQSVSAEYSAGVLSDLRKAQEQVGELSQQLIQAQNKSSQTALTSPIAGVVDDLSVHTLGGVVTPAEHLMTIVPDSKNLIVEARLEDRDVGFVHVGQPVKVKIETFNFTRYGLIEGRVVSVSRDVVNPDATPRAASTAPTPPPTAPPAYAARIALAKTSMVIDGQLQQLQPGMAVTADIRTGNRTIIDYLLSPLSRKTAESLHER